MARGGDQKANSPAPPRRNPFRQKILGPEDVQKTRTSESEPQPSLLSPDLSVSRQELIDQITKTDDFQEIRLLLMDNLSSDQQSCRQRYLFMPLIEARGVEDQREVEAYLGDRGKTNTLIALASLIEELKKEPSTLREQEALVCLNHFLLAGWVRRTPKPTPYMLQEHENFTVALDDIIHIDNMMKETVQRINQIILKSENPDEMVFIKSAVSLVRESFVREIAENLEDLRDDPAILA